MGTQFRLLRYFSIMGFISVAIVAVLLAMFYRHVALRDLKELAERHNIALTQAFSNSIWPQFVPFLTSASGLSDDELRAHPQTAALYRAILEEMRGLSVVKIKAYDLAGRTVFSTEARQIGKDQSANAGFLSARSGKVASELTHRDTFSAFDGVIENRDLLSSYIPIRRGGPESPVEAVFELYYDVSHFLQKVEHTQRSVVVGVMLIFALLYGVLFVIVRRAEGMIKRQGNEVKQYIEEMRKANEQSLTSKKELESINQRLKISLQELSGLYSALSPLDPSVSVSQMLDKVIERLMHVAGADAALIRLHDKATGAFICASQRGFPAYYLERALTISPGSSGSALEYVFKRGEPIISSDIAADPRLKGKVQLEVGFRSCAFLPLRVGLEVRGIVHLASREVGYFKVEKEEHLMTVARQMGIAIENRELFDQISATKNELEKASKVKDDFLGFVSHELRTPVNAVIGYTAMMQDGMLGEISPEQEKILAKVIGRSRDLLGMVNGLLEATRIEAGAVKMERDEVRLCGFLDELRSAYDVPLKKELTLVWDYPSDIPVVTTDREKLRHILQNLLNNAIKFTEKGSVTISAHLSSQASVKFSEFKVADTGIGIAEDEMPFIFDMFRQVEDPQRRSGGVGLGLHIVKKFTELLGGKIDVESESGKGSTFTVTIPYEPVHPTAHESFI